MSMDLLGETFDIHGGGIDLVFPHHEDEIAQSEAATGQPFVRTWLHCAHLRMDGEKMAKSTGNIARVGQLVDAGVPPRAIRYGAALGPLPGAAQLLRRVARRPRRPRSSGSTRVLAALAAYREASGRRPDAPRRARRDRAPASRPALDDDLNVSAALGALFDGIRELNRRIDARSLSTADAGRAAGAASGTSTRVLGVAAPAERGARRRAPGAARRARRGARDPRLGGVGPAARRAARARASPSRTRATASAGGSW